MGKEKKLFVAATSQNDGKTTFSMGLIRALQKRGMNIGFIKPIGQRYVMVEDEGDPPSSSRRRTTEGSRTAVDEDSVLVQRVCGLKCRLKDMSPIAIARGFTREFLDNPGRKLPILKRAIVSSYAVAAEGKDMVVVEGTGHAGVGSTFGLSNAEVARMIGASVVLVTTGGIGRPLDEIALSQALFREMKDPMIGVIVNKVIPERLDDVRNYLGKGLNRMGLRLLGVVPYSPRLSWPSVRQIMEELGLEVLTGGENLDTPVSSVVVGAMSLHNALEHVHKGCLMITPGDREDLLLATVMASILSPRTAIAGIVLTGNLKPRRRAMDILQRTPIPILLSNDHTYNVASQVNLMTVKIRETDDEKIRLAADLVAHNIDVQAIWRSL